MKKIILLHFLLLNFSSNTFSSEGCEKEAKAIALSSLELFKINSAIKPNCIVPTQIKEVKALAVTMDLPPKFSYEISFQSTCPPEPRNALVKITLNEKCFIKNLNLIGH